MDSENETVKIPAQLGASRPTIVVLMFLALKGPFCLRLAAFVSFLFSSIY